MKPLREFVFLAVLSVSVMSAQIPFTPPVAPRIEHSEMRHGALVTDDYFWLREKTNPKVVEYLEAENAYTEAMTKNLQPFSEALYAEMLGRIKQTDLSVPSPRSGYLYYSRTEEGKQYPIQCRRKGSMEAPEQVLLDLNELGKEHKFVGLGAFKVSDDQNLLAYTIDYTGFRQFSLEVKDLRTGKLLGDTIDRVTSVEWAADNRHLFVTTEDKVTKRSDRLMHHLLGSADFRLLYNEKDELYDIGLGKSRDRAYLFLQIEAKDTTEVRYMKSNRAQEPVFTVLLPRERKHRYYVDHRENLFYIRTNKSGKNFSVVTAPERDPAPKNWKVFIPHQDDVRLQDIDLFKDFAVSVEKSQALNHLRVYNFTTEKWTAIPFPEPVYSAFPDVTADFDSRLIVITTKA